MAIPRLQIDRLFHVVACLLLALPVTLSASERVVVTAAPPGALRVIVELAPSVDASRLRQDLERRKGASGVTADQAAGAVVDREFSRLFHGAALSVPVSSLDAIRAIPYVIAVHPDRVVHALAEPGVVAVRAPDVWSSLDVRGKGIIVAIIDTGVDYNHPALGGGIGPSLKVIGGRDFVANDDDPMDENGHGTHVAGIVAANSADLLGVAPEASLIAYRALDSTGQGLESNIIAALERAVADGARVVNLSLGGPGSADDPLSRAVNAAVDAGIVVCAAAGNDGKVLTIESPGAAARAITVGAADANGRMATFSSIGPSIGAYSIKPDVIAPGVNIRSCALKGSVAFLSGTSMATPHVAGIAALLRQVHPDWTPVMIKQVILANARAAQGQIMATGSGLVDALRSATSSVLIAPASLSFGVTDGSTSQFAQTRTLTIENRSSTQQDVTLSFRTPAPGSTLTVTPTSVAIPAGERREVEVTLTVDNSKVPFESTFSRGDAIEVRAGGETLRVPWAFVKGLRLQVAFDGLVDGALVTIAGAPAVQLVPVGDPHYETLVKPGSYDVTLFGHDTRDSAAPYYFAVLENQALTSDRSLSLAVADVRHRLTYRGADEKGAPVFPTPVGQSCRSHRTLFFPENSSIGYVRVMAGRSLPGLMTNTLSDRFAVYAGDLCANLDFLAMRVLSYRTVRGVSAGVERTAGGSVLRGQRVSLTFPPLVDGTRKLGLGAAAYTPMDRDNFGFGMLWSQPDWTGTVYMDAIDDPESATHPYVEAVVSNPAGFAWLHPDPFHIVGDRAASYRSRPMPPLAHLWSRDEVMEFGAGFSMPRPFFYSYSADELVLETSYVGVSEEFREPHQAARVRLFDTNGNLLAEKRYGMRIPLEKRVQVLIENDDYVIEGVQGKGTAKSTFGGNREDSVPPIFTTLCILDAAGRPTTRLDAGSAASLLVAAIDYTTGTKPVRIKEGSLSVDYRARGSAEWRHLTTVKHGEDYGTNTELQRFPLGTSYDVDLRDVTGSAGGYFDLRLTVEDLNGNVSETFLEPALFLESSAPVRRRSVRK